MSMKIRNKWQPYLEKKPEEAHIKAAFWDTICYLNRSESKWVIQFFWSEDYNSPSRMAHYLMFSYYMGGQSFLNSLLNSNELLDIAGLLLKNERLGGHPLREKGLFVLFRLASGNMYESVLDQEIKYEINTEYLDTQYISNKNRRKAINRANQRVKRAEKHLILMGYKVERMPPEIRKFYKLIKKASQKLHHSSEDLTLN